jgi:L-alanine-DL-glutamate epimerase-like enolase superfamily enzyme
MNTQFAFSPICLKKAEASVYRTPIDQPVQTSFGVMHDRPAVLVRIEDADGLVAWGEVWCNFPSVGAEHRARLFNSVIAPMLLEQSWDSPVTAFNTLSKRLHILGIQCGEPGTIAQVIAGADIAMWDLVGKKVAQPLWRLFGGSPKISTYASGLSPTNPEKLAQKKWDEGYRAFKLKVGFGADRDFNNLQSLRNLFGPDTKIMVDANQAWLPEEAVENISRLSVLNPFWVEEPLPADSSIETWLALAQKISPIKLAAGENMRGAKEFNTAIESDAFGVIQPDIGKWGGFSGCIDVGHATLLRNQLFCPHWLGGGIGLLASMHLKAAVGGPGFVEVDANPNPLRDFLALPIPHLLNGDVILSDEPGLGVEPDLLSLKEFLITTSK